MKNRGNMWEHVDFLIKCFKIGGNMWGNMWEHVG